MKNIILSLCKNKARERNNYNIITTLFYKDIRNYARNSIAFSNNVNKLLYNRSCPQHSNKLQIIDKKYPTVHFPIVQQNQSKSKFTSTTILLGFSSILFFVNNDLLTKCIAKEEQSDEKDKLVQNDDDDVEYDEEEERECPFCSYFLDSPCKHSFIIWQKCVKKVDQPTDCMKDFYPLKECMDEHDIVMGGPDDVPTEENNE